MVEDTSRPYPPAIRGNFHGELQQLGAELTLTCELVAEVTDQATQALLLTRLYERFADQAVSVTRWLDYIVTGVVPAALTL